MPDPPITTTGTVVAPRDAKTCLITLPNGKEVLGFLSRDLARSGEPPGEGARVSLELTPYDFSQARIVAVADPPASPPSDSPPS